VRPASKMSPNSCSFCKMSIRLIPTHGKNCSIFSRAVKKWLPAICLRARNSALSGCIRLRAKKSGLYTLRSTKWKMATLLQRGRSGTIWRIFGNLGSRLARPNYCKVQRVIVGPAGSNMARRGTIGDAWAPTWHHRE